MLTKAIKIIKQNIKTIVLVIVFFAFYLIENNRSIIEKYYSSNIYKYISLTQRRVTNWFSFSVGDIFYIVVITIISFRLILFLKALVVKNNKGEVFFCWFKSTVNFLLILFIFFKIVWGFNYSRQGISEQLHLQKNNYTKEKLSQMVEDFIFRANWYRKQIKDSSLPKLNFKETIAATQNAYNEVSVKYNFFEVSQINVKPSLFGFMGNYFGYTGYYNPFTGEAQVREDIPSIILPFVSCHEVAHQLGYASEDEASFVAFLVAENSNDIYLKYSTCLELIDEGLSEMLVLYAKDSDFKNLVNRRWQLENCMDEQVRKDRKAINLFFKKNKKSIASISTNIYDGYLKANKQSMGINSYSKVMILIFNYFEKKVKENINNMKKAPTFGNLLS